MIHLNKRSCPICTSKNIKEVKKVDLILFEKHPIQNGYTLVQCEICSFFFAEIATSQNELDEYYSNISKYEDKQISTGGGYNPFDKCRLEGVAKYISTIFPNKKIKIADVGCAIGGLLEQLRNEGFSDITGIDPSISCVEITKLEKKINCFHASLFNLNESFGQYDLIIISHVWEHILDINSALLSLEKILKPNGYIYIECPNAMNYKNTIHAPFQELNTEHINHFFETAFSNFFGLRNYECIDLNNKIVQIASGEDYDAVYGVFRKSTIPLKYSLLYDNQIGISMNEYISKSNSWFNSIIHKIQSELIGESQVAFFGIGQFAFKLLYEVLNRNSKLEILFFDNNILNVGKKIKESEILLGMDIHKYIGNEKIKIIITSLIHQQSIINNIRKIFSEQNLNQPLVIELK